MDKIDDKAAHHNVCDDPGDPTAWDSTPSFAQDAAQESGDKADHKAEDRITHLYTMLQTIQQIEQAIIHAEDAESLLQRACDLLVSTRGYLHAWVVRLASDSSHLKGMLIPASEPALALSFDALSQALSSGDLPQCVLQALEAPEDAAYDARMTSWSALDLADCEICPLDPIVEGVVDEVVSLRLQHGGRLYGLLTVVISPAAIREEIEMGLLRNIAGDLAYALNSLEQQSARREAEARLQQQAEMAYAFQQRSLTLIRIGNQLALADSVDELFRLAVVLGTQDLGFERIGIWLRCEDDPASLCGTYGIDEQGRLRDERGVRRDLDHDLLQWGLLSHPEVIYHERASLYDLQHGEVGKGYWARAMLWIDDVFLGLVNIDTLLSGKPITSRDRDILALFAATLSALYSRKRAEMALRESDALYRTLFATTGAATMVLDEDLTLILVNDETVKLLGYDRDHLQGRRHLQDFVVGDQCVDLPVYFKHLHDAPRDSFGVRECSIVNARDQIRDVAIWARPIPGTQRSVVSMLDVTARNRTAARNLRWARQQSALNVMMARFATKTDLGSMLDLAINQTLRALDTDLGAIWLQGRVVLHGLPDDIIRIGNIGSAESSHVQTALNDCDEDLAALGIYAPLAVPISSPHSDTPLGWMMVASPDPRVWTLDEISMVEAAGRQLGNSVERLQLLDRVRQEARRLQLVVDAVPEALILLGVEREIVLANAQGHESLATLAGVGVSEGDTLATLGEMALDELLKPQPQQPWRELKHSGRIYEVTSRPLLDVTGSNLQGWVLVVRDVTEARLAQQQLVQQERLAAVGRLAAGIAHDFNNIIAVIVLYAQLAMRQSGLPQAVRDKLAVVVDQGHRATDLIGQILDFSRRSPMERHPLDLLPYLKGICDLLQRTLPDNVRVDFSYGAASYLVLGDPTGIQQALMNLATNARDAMPGGGEIRVALQSRSFDDANPAPVESIGSGRWIVLTFTDTGDGISPDVLPFVFEPFFTTKETGVGLGLPQVFGIVKQHEGVVTINSDAGVGTTVSIYLPAFAEPLLDSDTDRDIDQVIAGQGQIILVVEDNPHTRDALVLALETLGYQPLEAENGRVALTVLEQHRDDVKMILSDAVMPEMGGAGLLLALRERGWSYPVVVVSGYLPPEDQQHFAGDPNFVTWLTKPVDMQQLAAAIGMALSDT